ncbi:MAG: DUF4230 domain-containing protein [Paludibacteraceae bacterium]|nr:DUF4230 domain-containing protein [Paludibacteraceae bacterium]
MKKLLLLLFSLSVCISCTKITTPSLTERGEECLHLISEKSELALSEYEISKIIRYNDTSIWQSLGDRKLLISCKVIVKAGIKLNKLDFSKCEINETNKTILLKLPSPEILSYNFPTEEVKIAYSEVGFLRRDFTQEERLKLLQIAENNLRENWESLKIIEDAKKNAHNFFVPLYKSIGFEQVYIEFESNLNPM